MKKREEEEQDDEEPCQAPKYPGTFWLYELGRYGCVRRACRAYRACGLMGFGSICMESEGSTAPEAGPENWTVRMSMEAPVGVRDDGCINAASSPGLARTNRPRLPMVETGARMVQRVLQAQAGCGRVPQRQKRSRAE